MKMNVLLSTAFVLIGACPGALSTNAQLRGADTAAGMRDIVEPENGPKYASGGPRAWLRESKQGERDNNCNPCYCNPNTNNSKKHCRDGWDCKNHKCKQNNVGGQCQPGTSSDTCCYKDKDCSSGGTCVDRFCKQAEIRKRTAAARSDKGGSCGSVITGPLCKVGLRCLDGTCVLDNVSEGNACGVWDLCAQGLSCNSGICRAPVQRRSNIGLGGICNLQNGDTCATGLLCIDGTCQSSLIPYGGFCGAGDICEPPYQCINGICGSKPSIIPYGGFCAAGDICQPPYQCINGICGSKPSIIPYGKPCGAGDTCKPPLECIGGICMDASSGDCTINCNCHNNDCALCVANCNCFGLCCMPRCGANCNKNSGKCPSESEHLQFISE